MSALEFRDIPQKTTKRQLTTEKTADFSRKPTEPRWIYRFHSHPYSIYLLMQTFPKDNL